MVVLLPVVGCVYVGTTMLTSPIALASATAVAVALVLLTSHAATRAAALAGSRPARTDTLY